MNQPTSSSAPETNAEKPLVYVVDDEVMILELISMVLEPLGYRVRTFADPAQAIRTYAAAVPRPDLLITDYAMHTINGMELIEQCRGLVPDQKILLASGTVGEEVFADTTAKPDRFLAKPFKSYELSVVVRELIGR
jgi:CheY-like chemotaxis protein